MKRNPYYRLEYIAGIPYLLAFGQANADFKRDVCLNDTGAFLWECLEHTSDSAELAALCKEHFQVSSEQAASLEQSVLQFLNSMLQRGILLPEDDTTQNIPYCNTLEIAGLFCKLFGPEKAFAPELSSFETNKESMHDKPIQEIRILAGSPSHKANGTLILRNNDLSIIKRKEGYILLFPNFSFVEEMQLGTDGLMVNIYCTSHFSEQEVQEISYAMRIAFFYFARLHGMLAIHSASILYRDRAWLFAAPSGTGKSTHAELWHSLHSTPVINGDLNLITLQNGKAVVHGIPWCGTSGIYDTHTHPLGGIILLEQGLENEVTSLPEDLKQLSILHRNVSPSWTAEMHRKNYLLVQSLYRQILVCRLRCTPDASAVACIRSRIEDFLDGC